MDVSVVPHAGTWIEITSRFRPNLFLLVVPHAGTWIEIRHSASLDISLIVVPHAGTWIEIVKQRLISIPECRRSPRGNVD